ncbi:MAG: Hsp20 family protein [Buchnera aphidicola (Eriosoma harunire)]
MPYRSFTLLPEYNNNTLSDRLNQIDKIFSTITGESSTSYMPAYNFIKINDLLYQLVISIPGYQENELDISVHKNQLSITGKKNIDNKNIVKQEMKFIHQGFKINNFSINFNLNYQIEVKKADLSLGLLHINFEYYIPEEEKPKKIKIKTNDLEKKVIHSIK